MKPRPAPLVFLAPGFLPRADFFAAAMSLPLRKSVQLERIAVQQLLRFVWRYAFHRAFDDLPRVRVGRSDVRIVRLPHDIVDADVVTQLHPRLLEPKVDI